jgi:tetratricopeptide (TPR) repeat protein
VISITTFPCYGKLYKTHKTKEFALKSFDITDKSLNYLLQLKLYVILRINEGRTKSYGNAAEYYHKAIKIAKAINNGNYTGVIYHNLGYLSSLLGKHQDAIENY